MGEEAKQGPEEADQRDGESAGYTEKEQYVTKEKIYWINVIKASLNL